MKKIKWLCFSVILAAMFTACCATQKSQPARETLNATLWMQTSAEYRMLTTQAYYRAAISVEKALIDPDWTAATEQVGTVFQDLPPAVIVDIDETVLTTIAFQAQLAQNGRRFTPLLWDEWTKTASARSVPGALEFIRWAAEKKNITIFYVTNRPVSIEPWTLENLRKEGFPVANGVDSIFSKGECGDRSSDKSNRRRHICNNYRVLLLIGDNLGDFIGGAKNRPENRIKAAEAHAAFWAKKWIVLPNPIYGSWEGALYDYDHTLSGQEILAHKIERLRR